MRPALGLPRAIRCALLFLTVGGPPHAAHADLIGDYYSTALQGDLRDAPALFAGADSAQWSEKERALEARFQSRFVRRDENQPPLEASPFVQEVVGVYRDYWTRSLMGELEETQGERFLMHRLRDALAAHGVAEPLPDDVVLERLKQELVREDWHVLGGVTRPYYDLMLWKTQESRSFDCRLTDATQRVEVEFLSDFVEWGWSHWATFGRAYTGGWATPEKLYCLRDDYDLESEKFKVSYIQHEGRHFADYKIFPKLQQIDLEYRAKLTELAFAEESLRPLIKNFAASGALNPNAPHSYANYCVVRDLSGALFGKETLDANDPKWETVPPETIHRTARTLVEASTAALQGDGAATTPGVVGPKTP